MRNAFRSFLSASTILALLATSAFALDDRNDWLHSGDHTYEQVVTFDKSIHVHGIDNVSDMTNQNIVAQDSITYKTNLIGGNDDTVDNITDDQIRLNFNDVLTERGIFKIDSTTTAVSNGMYESIYGTMYEARTNKVNYGRIRIIAANTFSNNASGQIAFDALLDRTLTQIVLIDSNKFTVNKPAGFDMDVTVSGNLTGSSNIQGSAGIFTTKASTPALTCNSATFTNNVTAGSYNTSGGYTGATVRATTSMETTNLTVHVNVSAGGNVTAGGNIGATSNATAAVGIFTTKASTPTLTVNTGTFTNQLSSGSFTTGGISNETMTASGRITANEDIYGDGATKIQQINDIGMTGNLTGGSNVSAEVVIGTGNLSSPAGTFNTVTSTNTVTAGSFATAGGQTNGTITISSYAILGPSSVRAAAGYDGSSATWFWKSQSIAATNNTGALTFVTAPMFEKDSNPWVFYSLHNPCTNGIWTVGTTRSNGVDFAAGTYDGQVTVYMFGPMKAP